MIYKNLFCYERDGYYLLIIATAIQAVKHTKGKRKKEQKRKGEKPPILLPFLSVRDNQQSCASYLIDILSFHERNCFFSQNYRILRYSYISFICISLFLHCLLQIISQAIIRYIILQQDILRNYDDYIRYLTFHLIKRC